MKSVQIRSFFWSVFSCIWTGYGDLRCKSPYSVRIQENKDQKKIRIRTLFTQCKLKCIWHKYTNYKKLKVTSSSGIFKPYIIIVVIFCYLESENYKVLKFHVNNSSYFEKSAPPLSSAAFQEALRLKASEFNKCQGRFLEEIWCAPDL